MIFKFVYWQYLLLFVSVVGEHLKYVEDVIT